MHRDLLGPVADGAAQATTSVGGGAAGPSSSGAAGTTSPTAAAAELAAKLQRGISGLSSAHIDFRLSLGAVAAGGVGDEKLANGKLQAMSLTERFGGTNLGIVLAGGAVFMRLPARLTHSGKPWLRVTASSSNPSVRQLASTINTSVQSASVSSLSAFAAAASSVTKRGTADVGGAPATHYSVVIDTRKLPADFPNRQALAQSGLTTVPVEMYVDGQGRPTRVSERFTISAHPVSFVIALSRFNQPVRITPPPANQVGTG
ncbi:MAG: hypothetical protein ACRDVG_11880 [Jatrophihabitantaceae bacterium]